MDDISLPLLLITLVAISIKPAVSAVCLNGTEISFSSLYVKDAAVKMLFNTVLVIRLALNDKYQLEYSKHQNDHRNCLLIYQK